MLMLEGQYGEYGKKKSYVGGKKGVKILGKRIKITPKSGLIAAAVIGAGVATYMTAGAASPLLAKATAMGGKVASTGKAIAASSKVATATKALSIAQKVKTGVGLATTVMAVNKVQKVVSEPVESEQVESEQAVSKPVLTKPKQEQNFLPYIIAGGVGLLALTLV